MIISGGVNIYPTEIENILKTHPDIVDVAIIGVPHPEWGRDGQSLHSCEKPIQNLDIVCKEFLKDKVAGFKIPRLYEQIDELPRNATGKILKQPLREGVKR